MLGPISPESDGSLVRSAVDECRSRETLDPENTGGLSVPRVCDARIELLEEQNTAGLDKSLREKGDYDVRNPSASFTRSAC